MYRTSFWHVVIHIYMYHYYTSTCACTQIWMLMNTCMYPDPPHLHMFSLIFPFLIAFWKRIYANRRQNLLLNPPLPPSSRTRITPCLLLLLIHSDIIRVPGNSHGTIPDRVPRMRPSSLLSHLAHSPLPLGFRCRL